MDLPIFLAPWVTRSSHAPSPAIETPLAPSGHKTGVLLFSLMEMPFPGHLGKTFLAYEPDSEALPPATPFLIFSVGHHDPDLLYNEIIDNTL